VKFCPFFKFFLVRCSLPFSLGRLDIPVLLKSWKKHYPCQPMIYCLISAHQSRVTSIYFALQCEWMLSTSRDKYFQWHCSETGRRLGGYQTSAWCTCCQYPFQEYHVCQPANNSLGEREHYAHVTPKSALWIRPLVCCHFSKLHSLQSRAEPPSILHAVLCPPLKYCWFAVTWPYKILWVGR
jgi:hypothetical protein